MTTIEGSDRVSIEERVHELYQKLTERSGRRTNPETSPFLLMKDVFMWAVAMGVKEETRRPLEGAKTQIFRWDQFSRDRDIPALKAIALAETEEVEILLHEDQILRIAEEYANAGIHKLRSSLLDEYGQPLWNLISMLSDVTGGLHG